MEYRLSRNDYFRYYNNQYFFVQKNIEIVLDHCPWCGTSLSIKGNITPKKQISEIEYNQIHVQDSYRSEKRILALGLDYIPIHSDNTKHCCDKMSSHLSNTKNYIQYYMMYREYCFSPYNDCVFLLLDYCPWCGKNLPKNLRSTFFNTLESEYFFEEVGIEIFNNSKLPSEFRTDEWWRKRGL